MRPQSGCGSGDCKPCCCRAVRCRRGRGAGGRSGGHRSRSSSLACGPAGLPYSNEAWGGRGGRRSSGNRVVNPAKPWNLFHVARPLVTTDAFIGISNPDRVNPLQDSPATCSVPSPLSTDHTDGWQEEPEQCRPVLAFQYADGRPEAPGGAITGAPPGTARGDRPPHARRPRCHK
jgi:hypothetical protein